MLRPLAIGALPLPSNLFLAPMAGITDLPVRLLARRFGAALCFTEMVSVNGLVREGRKSFDLVRSLPDDRPLGIQIFGDDPELMAEGAALVAGHGDLIDINMGCPVRKVVGSGAGSALLRDPLRVAAIIRAVRRRVALPLSVKIRSGWQAGDENYRDIAAIADYEAVVSLDRRNVKAYMGIGEARYNLGNFKEAIDNFKDAQKLDPNNAEIYEYLMLSYLGDNDIKNVRKTFEKYRKMVSEDQLAQMNTQEKYRLLMQVVTTGN